MCDLETVVFECAARNPSRMQRTKAISSGGRLSGRFCHGEAVGSILPLQNSLLPDQAGSGGAKCGTSAASGMIRNG